MKILFGQLPNEDAFALFYTYYGDWLVNQAYNSTGSGEEGE